MSNDLHPIKKQIALYRVFALTALLCMLTGCTVIAQLGTLGIGPGVSLDGGAPMPPKAKNQVVYHVDDYRFFEVEPYSNWSCKSAALLFRNTRSKNIGVVDAQYEIAPGTLRIDAMSTQYLIGPALTDTSFGSYYPYWKYFFVPFSQDGGRTWSDLTLPRNSDSAEIDLDQRGSLLYFDGNTKVIDLTQAEIRPHHRQLGHQEPILTPWRVVGTTAIPTRGKLAIDIQVKCIPNDLPWPPVHR